MVEEKTEKSKIIDCEKIANEVKKDVKKKVERMNREGVFPKLTVLTNPEDGPAKVYVRNKKRVCEEVGILFDEIPFTKDTVIKPIIYETNPIIIQLPLHSSVIGTLAEKFAKEYILTPERDADGFVENSYVLPATVKGVMRIFKEINYDLEGKHVCLIGRGQTCAKPLVNLLLDKNATLTICHSHTKNLKEISRECDVIISCVGKPHLITEDFVKEGAVVINVGLGVNPETNKVTGDVDFKRVKEKASYITKNIGGVGLLTTACLVENVVELYEKKILIDHKLIY